MNEVCVNWTSNRCFVCKYVCMRVCDCTKCLVCPFWICDLVNVPDAFDSDMRGERLCVCMCDCVSKSYPISIWIEVVQNTMECFGSHKRTHIQQIRLIIQSKCVCVLSGEIFPYAKSICTSFLINSLFLIHAPSILNPFNSIQSNPIPISIQIHPKFSQIAFASPQFYNPFFFLLLQIDLEI